MPHFNCITLKPFMILIIFLMTMPLVALKIEFHSFENKQQEQLYLELIAELRCVKCQNQNLAESNAELATDMRKKTYEMVKAGKTREDVVNYMTARYGDFVLYKPPFKSKTLLLWVGPPLLFLFSLFLLFKLIRNQKKEADTNNAMTESDRESIRATLQNSTNNQREK